MKIPIRLYGDPVLRKITKEIPRDYPNLEKLIDDMFETMYAAQGVGLAAPQIGLPIRLFIVDAYPLSDDKEFKNISDELKSFKKVFINPTILSEEGETWKFSEGCLSIPGIREDISRQEKITIEYLDENFISYTETFSDIRARIIQHEYDHIEGKLFTDYLSMLKKKLLNKKLTNISKGIVETDYKVKK